MTRMKKGGRELVVSDSDVAAYLNEGYAVIDEKGNVLSRAKSVTYGEAMAENGDLRKRVQALTASLEAAHTEIADLKKQLKAAQKKGKSADRKDAADDAGDAPGESTVEPKG